MVIFVTNKTVIFDMNGIVFSHSADFDPLLSSKMFKDKIIEYSKKYPKYKEAWISYQNKDKTLALEIERESVIKGLKGDLSELQIYEFPNALNTILKYYNDGHVIVFVSNSRLAEIEAILNYIFEKNNVSNFKKIISSFHKIDMSKVGPKSDKSAWKTVFSKFENITDIYEDDKNNLEAAGAAAKELGFDSKLHSSID